jgi:hypothetical protein
MVANLEVALPIKTNIASVPNRANDAPRTALASFNNVRAETADTSRLQVLISIPGSRNSDDRRLGTHIALQKLELLKHTAEPLAQNDTPAVSSAVNDNLGLEPTAS